METAGQKTPIIEIDPSILEEEYLKGVNDILDHLDVMMDEEDARQQNMEHPYIIRQIFREHPEIWGDNGCLFLNSQQRTAAWCIANCKTRDMGGFTASFCPKCGHRELHYRSCGNRHCPSCQTSLQYDWVDDRKKEVVPGQPYFHIILTCDHSLNPLFESNPKVLASLYFNSASEAIIEMCRDPHYLGATPGIISVLHTWSQKLFIHWHLHCIVSGCGLTDDNHFVSLIDVNKAKHGQAGNNSQVDNENGDHSSDNHADSQEGNDYFLPMAPLTNLFRNKFMDGLRNLWSDGKLVIPDSHPEWQNLPDWADFCRNAASTKWVGHLVKAFHPTGSVNAIDYLARYVFRTAISNSRVTEYDGETVTIKVRDNDHPGASLSYELPVKEFIRRVLSHVLPKGVTRVRYSGFLSNGQRSKKLHLIATLLKNKDMLQLWPGSDNPTGGAQSTASHDEDDPVILSSPHMSPENMMKKFFMLDICQCPNCKAQMIVWPPRPKRTLGGKCAEIPKRTPERQAEIERQAELLKRKGKAALAKIKKRQKK